MAKAMTCPCGQQISGPDDVFVDQVNAHLAAEHEGRTYPAEAILSMATSVPD